MEHCQGRQQTHCDSGFFKLRKEISSCENFPDFQILMHKIYWVMVTHAMSRNYNLHNTIGMCCLNMINQRCAVLCDSGSGINYLSKTDITKDRLESVSLIM